MNCNAARSRLHPYLDNELDLPSLVEIDRHLASCSTCRATFAEHSMLRSGVRRHAQYHAAPDTLAERIRARIGAEQDHGPPETDRQRVAASRSTHASALGASRWRTRPRWLELGAVAVVAAVVSMILTLQHTAPSATESLAEQVIAGHSRAVLTSHVFDVETSDQHTVKPWLSSKLDFSPPVADLSASGFPLVGGRLDYLDHRPVATIVYRSRQHVIDLFVWPNQDPSTRAPIQSMSKHGYNVLHWSDASMQYWAISDLNTAELERFAESYSAGK